MGHSCSQSIYQPLQSCPILSRPVSPRLLSTYIGGLTAIQTQRSRKDMRLKMWRMAYLRTPSHNQAVRFRLASQHTKTANTCLQRNRNTMEVRSKIAIRRSQISPHSPISLRKIAAIVHANALLENLLMIS